MLEEEKSIYWDTKFSYSYIEELKTKYPEMDQTYRQQRKTAITEQVER